MSLNASDLPKLSAFLNILGIKPGAVNLSQLINQLADTVSTYTFALSDANNIVDYTHPTVDGTITIPTNASVPIPNGATLTLINSSPTSVRVATIVAAVGVTFNWNYPLQIGPGGRIIIQQLGTNFWVLKEIYEELTLTWAWGNGLFTAAFNATFSIVRNLGEVSLRFPQIISTVGAPGAAGPTLTSSSVLASRFTPLTNVYNSAIIDLSGNIQTVPGRILVTPAGNISFSVNYAASANFSAGTSGVYESNITYDLN